MSEAGALILTCKETHDKIWCYPSHYVEGAFRLIEIKDLFSTQNSNLNLIEWRDLDLSDTTSEVPKYVAISHSWIPSAEAKRLSDLANRPLMAQVGDDQLYEMSWHGLCQAAEAVQFFKCRYLWIDLLCLDQSSDADKQRQVGKMGHIYESAAAVVVMPGGIIAAQGLKHPSDWITRAWTFQEAVLCPFTYVLVLYPPIHRMYDSYNFGSTGEIFHITEIDANLALSSLAALISCVQGVTVQLVRGDEVKDIEFKPRCLGTDWALISTLEGLMKRSTRSLVYSQIWRTMWLRTASRPQDIVFSVLHLFGVQIEVNYNRSLEDLIIELAAKTCNPPSWLNIGSNLPINPIISLLPAVPSYPPAGSPFYTVSDRIVPVRDFELNMDSYPTKYHTRIIIPPDREHGCVICSRVISVDHLYKDKKDESDEPDVVTASHFFVLSNVQALGNWYNDGLQICYIRKSDDQVWEVVGDRSWVGTNLVKGRPRSHIRIGGPPGAEITRCDRLDYSRNPEPSFEPGEHGGPEFFDGHIQEKEAKMNDKFYHGDQYGTRKLDNLAEQYQRGRGRERDIDKWGEWENELDWAFSEDEEEDLC